MIALTRLLLVVRKRLTVMVIGNALVCLGAMAFSHSAHAYGEVSGGLITSIYVNQQYGAVAYITISGTKTNNPCTNTSYQFVLNLATSNADANQQFAMLMAARVSQTPVTLVGTGSCDTNNVETLLYIVY